MSPAIDAATATTQPTVRAAALPAAPVQPSRRNTDEVASRVAMVMPLVGFEVTPTRPTIRAETVTKKNPATTTSRAASARAGTPGSQEKSAGTNVITRTARAAPP